MSWLSYKRDCRHFRSDRPCSPHKEQGVTCGGCEFYDPCTRQILILKFDALGDVVRTTSILHGIHARYPGARVTWYTKRNCADLFMHNPAVDQVLFLDDPSAHWILQSRTWDTVYALDASALTASIAASLKYEECLGYTLDDRGTPMPSNPEAALWMELGLNDTLKKQNQSSFFEHLYRYTRLEWSPDYRPQIAMSPEELIQSADFRKQFLGGRKLLVGINPGAGERWRYKRWTTAGYATVIDRLNQLSDIRVLMLGGTEDQPGIKEILQRTMTASEVVIAQPGSVRTFIKYVHSLDLLICGDTMALHLATALQKPIVSLFGPTSAAEIDLFRIGQKIVAPIECQGCYLPDCDRNPTCMDLITPEAVLAAVSLHLPSIAKDVVTFPS